MHGPAPLISPTTSRRTVPSVLPPANCFDYLLLALGFALSVLLNQLWQIQAEPQAGLSPPWVSPFCPVLSCWLSLSLGPILLWPLFYLLQRLAGRTEPLTWGEWLLGLAWLINLILAGSIAWQASGTLPSFLKEYFANYLLRGYILTLLSLCLLATLLVMFDLVSRRPRPWTHRLALGLLLWPWLPLAIWWFGRVRLH